MPARFRLFDNGGRTADRYTVMDARPCTCPTLVGHYRGRTRNGASFSETPYHPQGVGLGFELDSADWAAAVGRYFRGWGKRIEFDALPPDGKVLVARFLLEADGVTEAQARTLGTTLADCRTWSEWMGSERRLRGLPPEGVQA